MNSTPDNNTRLARNILGCIAKNGLTAQALSRIIYGEQYPKKLSNKLNAIKKGREALSAIDLIRIILALECDPRDVFDGIEKDK